MAVVKLTGIPSAPDADMTLDAVLDPAAALSIAHTTTLYRLNEAGGSFDSFSGAGLHYGLGTPVLPDGGTITGWTEAIGGKTWLQVSGASLSAATFTADLNAPHNWQGVLASMLSGNDTITGGSGNDHLLGFGGNDTIDGGAGNDTMEGGTGNDTYVIANAGDTIVEQVGEGTDTARIALVSVGTQFDNVENYVFIGKGAWTFAGNDLGDTITGGAGKDHLTGGAGNDVIDGGAGADVMAGGAGNDTYHVDNAGDTVTEQASGGTADTVLSTVTFTLGAEVENLVLLGKAALNGTGNAEANAITGNAAANVLDGQGGADILTGGAGNDTYLVDNLGDQVIEAAKGGIDLIKSSVDIDLSKGAFIGQEIENVTLVAGAGDKDVTGNALNNVIQGNEGNNHLDGGAGNDVMTGGKGDDSYSVDSLGDKVIEALDGGIDAVTTTAALKAAFANVENYTYTGSANWAFTGNTLDNTIEGNTGNDTLSGGGGKDTLIGGAGNDTYVVDSADDTVKELTGEGTDTALVASTTVKTAFDNVENYTLTGKGSWIFTGNDDANTITGGAGADTLDGGKGNDTLIGGAGNDHLTGGAGDDILNGGAGLDTLEGGTGNDTYIVDQLAEIGKIVETGGDSGDTLQTSVIIKSAVAGIENYTYTGKSAWVFTGTDDDNTIIGGTGSDNLAGGKGNDHLIGNAGNDTLDGGEGSDRLEGGAGNDIYKYDGKDMIVEAAKGGIDTVLSTVTVDLVHDTGLAGQELENVTLAAGAGDLDATGNGFNNTLTGNEGANTLDGGAGNDTLVGGKGDDVYIVDSAGDKIVESFTNAAGGGADEVRSSVSFSIAAFANVDNLTLTGNAAINGTGNSIANHIVGNAGDNILDGGAGNDTLEGGGGTDTLKGGAGNDTYILDNANITIDEGANKDTGDTVLSDFTVNLATLAGGKIENATLEGTADLDLTGNAAANILIGNDGANVITGGAGIDKLTGGKGADTFVFATGDTGATAGHRDLIADFEVGIDKIDLSKIDANAKVVGHDAFIFVGSSAFDGQAGELHVIYDAVHNVTIVEGDTNGNKVADFGIELSGKIDLSAADFTAASLTGDLKLTGDEGPNTLTGGAGNDHISGLGGDDTLRGNGGDDTLDGGAGNDILNGGTGADAMTGGAGNDTYLVDDAKDVVTEAPGGGTDTVMSSIALTSTIDNVENYTFTGTADWTFTGNALDNVNTGGSGNDTLDGGAGNDTLVGGAGDDTYFIGNGTDWVVEKAGEGTDTIFSSVDWLLADNIENLTLTGNAKTGDGNGLDNTIVGNDQDNALYGFGGNDWIDGGAGNDWMAGGDGNDTYVFDSTGDYVSQTFETGGIDTIRSSVSFGLNTLGIYNVENVILTGTANIDLTDGNSLDNTIVGNSGANLLAGGGGNDDITGGKGDTLNGESGDDQLHIQEAGFKGVDGGAGLDAVYLDSLGANIDLTGTLGTTLKNVEIIDISGGTSNTLTLDANSVAAMSGGAAGDNTLIIRDDAGDHVSLDNSWKLTGTQTDPFGQQGTYDVYTSGASTVLIQEHTTASLAAVPVLGDLDGTNGFRIDGNLNNGQSAFSVHAAGDINGDGFDDVIVGSRDASGDAYVIYGHAGGFDKTIELSSLGGSDGFKLTHVGHTYGQTSSLPYGVEVSAAGDVNGDGIDDFLVGAYAATTDFHSSNGSVYLIYGKAGGFDTTIDLENLSASDGVRINGSKAGDEFGSSVSAAGDLNGDGYDDFIVGADSLSNSQAGSAFVIFGHSGAFNIDLSNLDGYSGYRIDGGKAGDIAGRSVASAGDINGDGFADLIIGAPHFHNSYNAWSAASGTAYILFGHAGQFSNVDLGNLGSETGFKITGIAADDHVGVSVASAGDINGDGFSDIVVGSGATTKSSAYGAGDTYVLFGAPTGNLADVDLANLTTAQGFKIHGVNTGDYAGLSVSSAGDVNGDGYADILIGATDAGSGHSTGAAYVVYGHAGGFGDVDLSQLDGTNGFALEGAKNGDYVGWPVSAGGDINGDGFSDLILGAYLSDPNSQPNAGSTFVFFGGNFTGAVTHLGTSSADVLDGDSKAEGFVAGNGADVINAGGGKDFIQAGTGDDQIHVADGTFAHVDGGSGTDTLHLDFAGTIDFGNLDGNAATSDRGKIANVEVIDATNGQSNAMTLHLADVLDIHAQDTNVGGVASLDNVLTIKGETGDTLHLSKSDGWSAADTATLAGYAIYTDHAVKIAVDTHIAVTVS